MIISHITLLPIDNQHAVAVDIGIAIKPGPVRLKVIELDVVAKLTKVSNDFNIVVIFLYFYKFFWICYFNVVDMVIKTVNIIQFIF